MIRNILIASAAILAVVALAAPSQAGVSDIYISFSDFGDGGAAGNTSLDLQVGQSGSAYIWVNDTYQIDTGAFLDVFNSNTGAIQLTDSEVFNPTIFVATIPVDTRWQEANKMGEAAGFGGGTVTDGMVDEMFGFTVTQGTGILPTQTTGNTFEDGLHDPGSSAFLFARVDFVAVGTGVANFNLGIGDGLIVDGGVALDPLFGGVNVNVVPEPASTSLMVLGLVAMGLRRRR